MKTTLDLTADTLDVREIIERIEELEAERDACTMLREDGEEEADPQGWADQNKDDAEELAALLSLMEDMRGYGSYAGDEKWRGDWYPITLIRDSYFKDYAQELADDIGAIPNDAQWPLTCIDWEQAARELQHDYTSVQIEGVTYWYR